MVQIALTGAAGNIGRELLDAFGDDADVVPFTHSEQDGLDSELLDVTDSEDVIKKLDTFEVVIHLAGASSPDAEWETVSETNIQGTKNVLDAAIENGVDRIVFASSNHAVRTYNWEDGEPERLRVDSTRTITANTSTRPDSFYGVSKAACEDLTKFYADTHDLEIVNLRIGWYMSALHVGQTLFAFGLSVPSPWSAA